MKWRELLLAILLIWQGVQLLYIGALGVPGVFLIPLGNPFAAPPRQAGEEAPVARQQGEQSTAPPAAQPPRDVLGEQSTETARLSSALPTAGEIQGWVKSQAREFVGGVDEAGNILYRFDVWLEPPADQKQRMVAVDYVFDAPSAKPASRSSKDAKDGFRVHFGGLSCAHSVSVTVTFDNGESREAEVDGCSTLR